jgi:hypothetical protein
MAQVLNSPGSQNQPPPAPVVEAPQPIVRVMRLYKPVMHMFAPMPQLKPTESIYNENNKLSENDFALSNFLLLPDSFGDIYLGEKFSAYISTVNGVSNLPFTAVQLSVKLKTANSSVDLQDVRPINGKASGATSSLKYNDVVDLVVEHVLTVVGTHSLRVMVEYVDPTVGEQRVLVKNYKFTVLNPILISASAYDFGNKFVVQCQLTNCTRTLLFLEDVSY